MQISATAAPTINRQIVLTPAAHTPKIVETPAMEPIEYYNMEDDNETEEDILER
jgi:hypothetical protein